MPITRQIAVVSLFVLRLAGCDSFKHLTIALDGKADATRAFWARFQGIQWRGHKAISSSHITRATTVSKVAFNGVARAFSMLSGKHSQIATQLIALDANNVDGIASGYRDRLVAAHEALSEEWRTQASATSHRDMQSARQGKARLESLPNEYAHLYVAKHSVLSKLKNSYDPEFDFAE